MLDAAKLVDIDGIDDIMPMGLSLDEPSSPTGADAASDTMSDAGSGADDATDSNADSASTPKSTPKSAPNSATDAESPIDRFEAHVASVEADIASVEARVASAEASVEAHVAAAKTNVASTEARVAADIASAADHVPEYARQLADQSKPLIGSARRNMAAAARKAKAFVLHCVSMLVAAIATLRTSMRDSAFITTFVKAFPKRIAETLTKIAAAIRPIARTAARATAQATRTAARATHSALTAVRANTLPTLRDLTAKLHTLWNSPRCRAARAKIREIWLKRPKCPYTLYLLVTALMTAAATIFIQWGMYTEPSYDDPNAVDETTKALNSVNGQLTRFVAQMWLSGGGSDDTIKLNWLLNFCALGMIYLVIVFVLNRFWVATALFGITMSVYAVANSIKMDLRNEPILPSDLSFLSSGNGGEIASFIPSGSRPLVHGTITMLVWLTVICLVLQLVDGRRCVIPFHWRRPFRNAKTIVGNVTRLVAAGTSIALLCSFTWTLSIPGAWGYEWAKSWGDSPQLWNAAGDAQANGPTINFLRLTHPKIMDKPEGYSQKTMEELAQKYAKQAQSTNKSRKNRLTDSTVVMILSETFSDPTRVPGISVLEDPMPNIRAVKDSTTSGLMLSPGYGGGTANIEYQTLTGLDLALFDDSMQSMYQELVPHQKSPYSFNQIWNARYGKTGSTAFHPYYKNMYLRDGNYKKFGFDHFYTLDSKPAIAHQDTVDNNPYVSDAASYQNVIDQINKEQHPQFVQLVTMQNHSPHSGWYNDNQFDWANVSENLGDDERYAVNTYMKGVNITDQATADFLNQLDAMDKPVTVIFYGDHLPSDYTTAAADRHNDLTLHETDYFIWSNQASGSAGFGVKLDPDKASTSYTSPNYFMALASEHMGAKVSPYLAFLSSVRDDLPAMERLVLGAGGFTDDTSTTYLDKNGDTIKRKNLSEQQRELLKEYRLVQYDMTAGKNYLADTSFFDVK